MGEKGQMLMSSEVKSQFGTVNPGLRRIAAVYFPGMVALDLVGPLEAFHYATMMLQEENGSNSIGYQIDSVGMTVGKTESMSGVQFFTDHATATYGRDVDILMIPGMAVGDYRFEEPDFISWVQQQATRSNRLMSVCSGAYVYAKAGLLNGATITTHWNHSANLRSMYPEISVSDDSVFCKSGNIYSSGGVTAGVDLALAIITEDFGSALALKIAKRMVVYLKRPGNQAQYSDLLAAQSRSSRFSPVIDWIENNLQIDMDVSRLSEICAMSPRNFSRAFNAEMTISPMHYVRRRRLERAKHLLEGTDMPFSTVARTVGFASAERFSRAFSEVFDISPTDYRERFGTT
ncbi:MAG: AraC family transcriptional regulator [Kordiimonadales bacterium]|nr:MAG: AraC family transcriptional regulator [Kordiimonadales bacterium]